MGPEAGVRIPIQSPWVSLKAVRKTIFLSAANFHKDPSILLLDDDGNPLENEPIGSRGARRL